MNATKARAYLDVTQVDGIVRRHFVGEVKVDLIVGYVRALGGTWDLPPVLIMAGPDRILLDGHHRVEAATRLGIERIPAWIVPVDDINAVIDAHFESFPNRMRDLDRYIDCDGTTYADLRLREV